MDPGTNLSGVSISVYSAMFLRILTLIKSISHIFRYMIINFFFVMMNVQLSVITLVLWEEVFFLEITANKIFFTKPIMQSLSFVFIVNKAQIDPKWVCWHVRPQTDHTVSESCVFTLQLGLNISTKLDEMLVNTVVVFFCPCGLIEASFYEITPYCSPWTS